MYQRIFLYLITLKSFLYTSLAFSQSITRDANNRITAVKYANHTITYEYGSNGERTKRIISENSANALPVNMSSFTAKKSGVNSRMAILQWTTTSERNSKQYEIEHSLGGINFQKIGVKTAVGNTTKKTSYEFLHNNPVNGTNYYRLKAVDQDNTSKYTPIRTLIFDFTKGIQITIYPNPANQYVNVQVSGITVKDKIAIYLYALDGHKVSGQVTKTDTSFRYRIDTSNQAAGTYMVTININGVRYAAKLAIKH